MENSNHPTNEEIAAALKRVGEIDLSKINKKLQHDDPDYWTDGKIAEAEEAYRRYLALNLLYPEKTLAVNKVLDDYWHSHILDTRKYAEDCNHIFGKILEHYPYFGLPGEKDEGENVPAFAVTQRVWEEAFGTPLVNKTKLGPKPRLTLDRVLSGLPRLEDDGGPDGGPKGCKNGQHCQKMIAPPEIEASDPLVAVSTAAIKESQQGG
jgi:hypothetical protein